jgi:phosphoribosylanthranilate isomerase
MVMAKVCGITRPEDARFAAKCGAGALGFIFVPGSKRCVSPELPAALADDLPPFVWRVGVFADQPVADVLAIAAAARLDMVQLHGRESADTVAAVAAVKPVLRAVLVYMPDLAGVMQACAPHVRAFLVDSGHGTGRTFDWSILADLPATRPIVVAGGLDGGNVGDLLRVFRPAGVDASSRLESAPGLKDHRLVAAFVAAAGAAAGNAAGAGA